MPITQSAKKALRQNIKRRKQNLLKKDKIKSLTKELRKLLAGGKLDDTKKLLPQIYKAFDKAAKTNAIKKNKASRSKSRLAKLLNKQGGPKS